MDVDIERVVKLALKAGADEAEAYRVFARGSSATLEGGVIKHADFIELEALGIRVAVGRKVATVGTERVDEAGIREAVEAAVSIAKALREDPNWRGLNDKLATRPAEGFYDRTAAEAGPEDMASIVRECASIVKGFEGAEPVSMGASAGEAVVEVMNSYGGPVSYRSTSATYSLEVKVRSGGEEGVFYDSTFSRGVKGLKAEDLTRDVVRKAFEYVGGRPVETGVYDLILTPEVAASFIDVMLVSPLSALSVQEGRSPLAGRVGEAVLSKAVTLTDVGTDPKLLGCRPFDDEGFPTTTRALVKEGILLDYVYDTYTARREGRESTGNAWRPSYSRPPVPSVNHLRLEPGDSSPEEMIAETRRGLLIERTIGEWLSRPVSGLLNATVTHAKLVIDGEVKHPVKGVVVSGNIYSMLGKDLALLGRTVGRVPRRVSSPHLLIKGVRVAGM